MPLPLALAPLLLAASPVSVGEVVGPSPSAPAVVESSPVGVEVYDPVGRALLIAERIPRTWTGTYQAFGSPASLPAVLRLQRVTPLGQMVDLRGELSLDGVSTPVQGNINAKSNQLDLLLLGTSLGAVLEPGGEFQGQQGLSLSGWLPDRTTGLGGRLQLNPREASAPTPSGVVRGLW